jgi:Na+:H+ antiporter, NhaA family
MPATNIFAFLKHEATSGIIIMLAAALALLIDNSPLRGVYAALLDMPITIQIGAFRLEKTTLLLVNDGLMAVFFLLIGLEIKRELLLGELSTREQALLPLIASIGGMVIPACIYALININDAVALRGWAIPAATDIAFALGVLALLGSRVPPSLKVFLLAFAIIDDLGSIIIIALFYTQQLSALALAMAAMGILVLAALNLAGVRRIAAYIVTGVLIWVFVLKSGVHATLAGVLVGIAVPIAPLPGEQHSPLDRLEEMLHPWVAYGILPLFAFANAGVSLAGATFAKALQPISLGILCGLLLGKPMGIFGASWVGVRLGRCRLPEGANWVHMVSASMLGGIGFTMSLFIGTLAFPDATHAYSIRVGVLGGSVLSAIGSYVVLLMLAEPSIPAED